MRLTLFIFIVFGFLFSACSLSKKKCPIPSCKISKMHQHALIFTNEGKGKKAKEKLKKELSDSTQVGEEGNMSEELASDSTQVSSNKKSKKEKKKKKKEADKNDSLTDEERQLLEESGETIEPVKKKKEKKKKEKKKKDNEDDGLSDLSEEDQAILDAEDAEKNDEDDLKLSPKEIRKADKEARNEEKRAKKEESEKDPFNVAYRSRITPWWGKDQHPEVGEDWKRAKKVYPQPDERKARKLFRNLFGYPTR